MNELEQTFIIKPHTLYIWDADLNQWRTMKWFVKYNLNLFLEIKESQ